MSCENRFLNCGKTIWGRSSKPTLEGIIHGKTVKYDAVGTGDLERLKKVYHAFDYIGSGRIAFANGRNWNYKKEKLHFFIYKPENKYLDSLGDVW